MENSRKIEPRFSGNAKWLIDALFDAKVMREDITRDQMNETEKVVADLMQDAWDSHIRVQALIARMEELKKKQVQQ